MLEVEGSGAGWIIANLLDSDGMRLRNGLENGGGWFGFNKMQICERAEVEM